MKGLKKFKKTVIKHKKIILGTGIFAIVGLIALLIGFEITNDWHAIRNWLASDNATTFFILAIVGAFIFGLLILVAFSKGDE